ncbi:MAG: DUF3391 domain-containing protein [Gammaproteobacteria bacterium]|uniref:HD-GYP domain-containing protein n=1 Tax=Rhodoferax sp. TaxID=50421 RepID=UPI0017B9EB4A|nr:HD-GYP domain-containing protein [Rhodoferax sp.]MBU3897598.1 DUF3391 domain-containing protein [Gammaproteobacteria bacterium]MBA3058224.1 DUF3391 domain-containing protein [Rhodoferax sp.]MBU4017758.1 DUF3391 domain-containing protein [Gammaproteobacteria bacterium]MBU4081201.1 DUF3391 domain-containing protein [Gammaproteobacteria bacterium]MBU4112496.1 DUF3391 domain-containing protein [Gammaproteobacteria bacterium]
MNEEQFDFIEIHQLRPGMFIELELGWMSHPFPTGSFKIGSEKQLAVIRSLGLKRVRHFPAKSDPLPGMQNADGAQVTAGAGPGEQVVSDPVFDAVDESLRRKQRSELLSEQQRHLIICERRFVDAIQHYKLAVEQVSAFPGAAAQQCLGVVNGFVGDMLEEGELAIRLLSEGTGDKASMHPVNVTVLSLLLGRSLGLPQPDMIDLGMAAFLHDIGKTRLPDRVRWPEENFSSAEYSLYQDHVAQGIALGQSMALSASALQTIAQHHESMDGSGFPARLKGDHLSPLGKILSLVNQYDNLCNPSRPSAAITPHEALALIFAQLKNKFDSVTLSAFIRMMGVYPPGSVVQLVDERFALVVSVNSTRPLKPQVMVFEPRVPRHEALILDLEYSRELGIRRSLKPASLPRDAMDYLSPRQRICYFFENAMDSPSSEVDS